jgi:cytochrome P450 family 4
VSDAESIETLFTNKSLNKKNTSISKIANCNGTVVPDDDKWKIHRRIISSTFNSNVLDHFVGNFVENSSILTQKLRSRADGPAFDIYPFVCACALDVICETTMGTNVNSQMEGNDVFMKILLHDMEELGETFKNPWAIKDWLRYGKKRREKDKEIRSKYLREFVDKVVEEKLQSCHNGFRQNRDGQQVEYVQWVRGKEMCLLDLLLQDVQLSVGDVRDELCTLIVAATKVTAATCCYVLLLLGVYQEAQDKVFEEQKKIFGEDMRRAATSEDLISMKYLEQVCDVLIRQSLIFIFYFKVFHNNSHSCPVSKVSHLKALNEFRVHMDGVCAEVKTKLILFSCLTR